MTNLMTNLIFMMNKLFMLPKTGIDNLDTGLGTIKKISIGAIAGIGVVIVAWGGFELGAALFQHDTSQVPNAIKKIVAGVIMIGIGALVTLFV